MCAVCREGCRDEVLHVFPLTRLSVPEPHSAAVDQHAIHPHGSARQQVWGPGASEFAEDLKKGHQAHHSGIF